MITIIYGEEIVKSRKLLEQIKNQHTGSEIINLDGKKISLTEIKQNLESNAMFTSSKLVVLENLSSNKKLEDLLLYFKNNEIKTDLIIWEGKEVNKTYLKAFPQAQVLVFKPEAALFKFLETIRPKNTKEMLTLLLRCFKVEEPEIIFYMLVRQFRFLLLLRDGVDKELEELDRLQSWQKERFLRQAKQFPLEDLLSLYHELLKIDTQQKTGQANFNLTKSLELFVTNI